MRNPTLRGKFSLVVLCLGIIILTPAPLLANAGMPFVFVTVPLMVLGLIPVILIEAFILGRRLKLQWPSVLAATTVANLASTAVGLVIANWVTVYADFHPRSPSDVASPFVLLLPLFSISWLVEYPIARRMLRPGRPVSTPLPSRPHPAFRAPSPEQIRWGTFAANVASYLFLALIAVILAIQGGWWKHSAAPQASALGYLRLINTSEVTYSSTYPKGFSPTLAALGPPAKGTLPGPDAADLIDGDLAAAEKSEYRFTYRAAADADGVIRHYTLSARPLKYVKNEVSGKPSFFTNETGIIRATHEDREALDTDSPLPG